MPLPDESALIALGPQLLGEGPLVLGEILDVADVALVVGQQLVAEGAAPVNSEARAGVQIADGVNQESKRVPVAASASRFGVRQVVLP